MIVRESEEGWFIITQPDHANLSGEIMARWGNEEFSPPEPYDEVLFAIYEHDNGWKEWEDAPQVNPANGFPMSFLEMDPKMSFGIWRRCFGRYSETHPYVSALIALHFDRLNERFYRPGSKHNLEIRTLAKTLHTEIEEFVLKMLKVALPGSKENQSPLPEEVVQTNLRFVQIGDLISLILCRGVQDLVTLNDVPIDYKGSRGEITLRAIAPYSYGMSPSPFSPGEFTVSVRGRRLKQKKFKSSRELQDALAQSNYEELSFLISET